MFFKIKTTFIKGLFALISLMATNMYAQDQREFTAAEIKNASDLGTSMQHITSELATANSLDVDPYTYVSLKVKDNTAPHTLYKFSMNLRVIPVLSDGTLDAVNAQNILLEVENNRSAGGGEYVDLRQYNMANSYGASVEIVSISFEDTENNAAAVGDVVPDNVVFTIGFQNKRYYELPLTAPGLNEPTVSADGQLQISWNPIAEAEYYDLEWTWVDNYSELGRDIDRPLEDILFSEKDFQQNHTRIQTTKTDYKIPLVYARGYIIYRVRSVGYFLNDLNKIKYGEWSSGSGAKTSVESWPHKYRVLEDHELGKNWQFQASYAEDGKKKEVTSYFDGSLRNRQTVTNINTDEHAVIGEVIYDAQGRPAIEVLPVPVNENKLKYYPNFNTNSSGAPYSHTDFDKDTQNEPDEISAEKAMGITSGASQYYSPGSTIDDTYRDRIANANGFPFSQIEYTPDNTGRIRRKSGVGDTHRLGSRHEMEYFYAVPEQKELNRLFGYSVGNALHYKKNMVLDPNGQLSISYIDPQGRTIATALAGDSPPNMIGLDDEGKEDLHKTITTDLLGKVSRDDVDTNADLNQVGNIGIFGPINDRLTYAGTKSVAFSGNRKFDYELYNNTPYFVHGCVADNSYPFVYDLSVDILDEDANTLLDTPIANLEINLGEETQNTYVLPSLEEYVTRGTFTVTKQLKVNADKVNEYADNYIVRLQNPQDPCYVDPVTISTKILEINGCFTTAEECRTSITSEFPTAQDYVDAEIAAYDQDQLALLTAQELADFETALAQQYNDILQACDDAFGNGSNGIVSSIGCQSSLQLVLMDMGIEGQYGAVDKDLSGTIVGATDDLSIFNEGNKLLSTLNGSAHKSWKDPLHYQTNASKYYNEDGTPSYVKVLQIITPAEIEGEEDIITYVPEVEESAQLIQLTDAEADEFWVEPQDLLHVVDFLNVWQTSWAASLIVYHPEYDYLQYAEAFCDLTFQSGASQFTSDGFDAYLQSIGTYQEAVDANLLDDFLSIYALDPYFNTTPGGVFDPLSLNNARKALAEEALKDNFDGSDYPMMTYSYALNICNSITPCDVSGGSTIGAIIADINSKSPDQKNRFWSSYMTGYIGFKQRVQSLFSDAYALKQGSFNGCIGAAEASADLVLPIATYDNAIKSALQSYLNGTTNELCNYEFAELYISKQKRFIPSNQFFNGATDAVSIYDEIAEQVNYNYYVNSGICPLARDLEIFLGGYFNEAIIIGNQPYNDQYLTPNLFSELGGTYPASTSFSVQGADLGDPNSLVISFNGPEIIQGKNITIDINDPNLNWSNYGTEWSITSMANISSSYNLTDENFIFSILARLDVGGVYREIVLSGTTDARIAECSISDADGVGEFLGSPQVQECDKRQRFQTAMVEVLNELKNAGQLQSGSYTLSASNAYTQGYLSKYFEDPEFLAIWGFDGFNYQITIDDESMMTFNFGGATIPTELQNTFTGFRVSGDNYTQLKINYYDSTFDLRTLDGGLIGKSQITTGGGTTTSQEVGTLLANLLDHLLQKAQNGDTFPAAYNPVEMQLLAPYISCPNPQVYNFNYSPGTMSFFFGPIGDGPGANCCPQTIAGITCWGGSPTSATVTGIELFEGNYNVSFNDGCRRALEGTVINVPIDCLSIPTAQQGTPLNFSCCDTNEVALFSDSFEDVDASLLTTECVVSEQWILTNGFSGWQTANVFDQPGNSPDLRIASNLYAPSSAYACNQYVPSGVNTVPDGEVFAACLYRSDSAEHFYGAIQNLEIGEKYRITFDQISLGINNTKDLRTDPARWVVALGGAPEFHSFLFAPYLTFGGLGQQTWQEVSVTFTARHTAEGITFYPTTDDPLADPNRFHYLGIDNIRITKVKETVAGSCPTAPCIPQPIAPVSCTDLYPDFQGYIAGIADDIHGNITEEQFCNRNYAYAFQAYKEYMLQLGITSSDQLHYITIGTFASSEFGAGYNDIDAVIIEFAEHVRNTPEEGQKTWVQFVSDYIYEQSAQGTLCLPLPVPLPIDISEVEIDLPEDSPCEQFSQSVNEAYTNDIYDNFLDREREAFVKAYLKNATENAVENFDMTYQDKEYQYTLYYYDQAGNLTQTVPPEGVDRFSDAELSQADASGTSLNDKINTYRNTNASMEDQDLLPDHQLKTAYKYNSLNQLVWQSTPDGGITRFAYDQLGRIIASQNAKQKENNAFSYTLYDGLGRIQEAGELTATDVAIQESNGKLVDLATGLPVNTDFTVYPNNISSQQREVTRTVYTKGVEIASPSEVFETIDTNDNYLENARNRVTAIYYYDTFDASTNFADYKHAMFYHYDIHGNVKELAQHHTLMVQNASIPLSGIKRIQYEYDLISGNVNKVYYQKDKEDQFIHRYHYDADNRIIQVETSSDDVLWETEAKYEYFSHGPLARTIIGDKEVQGVDYAYTLQGWLKGVNSDTLDPTNDMGGDGATVAKDAFGYTLTYHDTDYQSIGNINAFVNSTTGPQNLNNLYNGNIKKMVTGLMDTDEVNLASQMNHYEYDQLNRIKEMQGHAIANGAATPNYSSGYSYDNNGNLSTLKRSALDKQGRVHEMDDLTYFYKTIADLETGVEKRSNQLDHVDDAINGSRFNDLKDQKADNYTYDAIGQLISDKKEGLTNIEWRVDGKVSKITKDDGTTISFSYDGLGNRIAKTVQPENKTTLYVRDAQGNPMAVYEANTSGAVATEVRLKENHIYGSSRLGLEERNIEITETDATTDIHQRTIGDKRYELSNHLGNVLSVISDRKLLSTSATASRPAPEYLNNFEDRQDGRWNRTRDASFVIENGQLKVTITKSRHGVNGYYALEAGKTYTISVDIERNQFVPNLQFNIFGKNKEYSETIATSGTVTTTFTPTETREYRLNFIMNQPGYKGVPQTFSLDNLIITENNGAARPTTNLVTFTPDVLTYSDYYPFGMLLPNRHGNSSEYRYGFNGKEKDDEVKGAGNSYNYRFRMHDPRIGRFFAPDPLEAIYPQQSTYVFAANSPIQFVDIRGAGPGDKCKGCGKAEEKNTGDTFTEDSGHFTITYEVAIENDVKYWIIKSSEFKDSYEGLNAEEQMDVLKDYIDKTGYVKVQEARPDTFAGRADIIFNPFNDLSSRYEMKEYAGGSVFLEFIDQLPVYNITDWKISADGFIHISDAETVIAANMGSALKLLQKAKPIWQVVRSGSIFKNGSNLQKMVANYYKKFGYVGKNGTPATQLLHEFRNGQKLKHLDKVLGYRKAFVRAIRGSDKYGALTKFQKDFLIKELHSIQNILEEITKTLK